MRNLPAMKEIWLGGEFTGDTRPMARVTIQKMQIQLTKLDPTRTFASAMFGQGYPPQELPNLKSISWNRSTESDAGSCTMIFYNTAPLPLGDEPESLDFDEPGHYTYNYGRTTFTSHDWHQNENVWQDYLVPDRIIRSYEGYGFDPDAIPEEDTNLVQTGVWLIDDVEYGTDGLITVTCRDMARLLVDQIMYPPVIPLGYYPLKWDKKRSVPNKPKKTTTGTVFHPKYETDSGVPYNGLNGAIYGHRGSQAFDSSPNTYWLSIGNDRPTGPYSFEFVQGKTTNATVTAIKAKVWGGPYRVYASIKINGHWQGKTVIPYDPNNPISAPNGANIPFVAVKNVGREGTVVFDFGTAYHSVDSVRLTFTGLSNSGLGAFPFRAGVRDFQVSSAVTHTSPGGTHVEGDYDDYSEIVKYLLSSGGFWWPRNATAFETQTDGTRVRRLPPSDDPFLTHGRVWGDIMMAGKHSAGDIQLDLTIWDKKPLMDGVNYVRDILGFIFFVDETGGAVFRLPNIYEIGNYIGDNSTDAGYSRDATKTIEIDERQTLIGLRAKLTSKDIREFIFVATTDGKTGATAPGFNPITPDPHLRRVGGWTDENFASTAECQRMAELITIRQMFAYRSDTVTIVAFPGIQIDDQVRIFERTTGEGYLHYVKEIKSTNDLSAGKWTYDLTTHWLGVNPTQGKPDGTGFRGWAFDAAVLSKVTTDFLKSLSQVR